MPKAFGAWQSPPPAAEQARRRSTQETPGAVPKAVSKAAVVAATQAERAPSRDAKAELAAQIAAVKARLDRVSQQTDNAQSRKRTASPTAVHHGKLNRQRQQYVSSTHANDAASSTLGDAAVSGRASAPLTPKPPSTLPPPRVTAMHGGSGSRANNPSEPRFCCNCGVAWNASGSVCSDCGVSAKDLSELLRNQEAQAGTTQADASGGHDAADRFVSPLKASVLPEGGVRKAAGGVMARRLVRSGRRRDEGSGRAGRAAIGAASGGAASAKR